MGTAIKIEQLLLKTFPNELLTNVRIITLEKEKWKTLIACILLFGKKKNRWHHWHRKDRSARYSVYFFTRFTIEAGHSASFRIIRPSFRRKTKPRVTKKVSAKYIQGLSIEAITDLLTVLNPTTISIELAKIYSDICLQTKIKSDEKILLRFIIHCACMLERQLLNPEYDPTAYEVSYRELPEAVSVIKWRFDRLKCPIIC